MSNEPVEKVLL